MVRAQITDITLILFDFVTEPTLRSPFCTYSRSALRPFRLHAPRPLQGPAISTRHDSAEDQVKSGLELLLIQRIHRT